MKDMNSCPLPCSDGFLPGEGAQSSAGSRKCTENEVIAQSRQLGACACAVVRADEVDAEVQEIYDRWLAEGRNGTMQYCERYSEVRNDPRLLLPGCKWLIVCAFKYFGGAVAGGSAKIARYALGEDYHSVLSQRLQQLSDYLTENYGGETMIAVDTKPLRERYWAVRAGLGYIGRNNQLIVPGAGSYVLLATLLWTGELEEPNAQESADLESVTKCFAPLCEGCDACLRVCPNGALRGDGSCDCTRCISYLTIEHKGEIPPDIDLRGWLYGCDLCQSVCPYNKQPEKDDALPEFQPRRELLRLDIDTLKSHSNRSWQRFLGNSSMTRVPLKKLLATLTKPHL